MIGAIVQARMSSKRFPGKVLHKINGKPMLQYLLESLSLCNRLDKLIIATSEELSDDPLSDFCMDFGVECYRGALDDVCGRLSKVVEKYGFNAFVRINGDSPLLDYRLLDKALSIFNSGTFDLVTNVLKRTYPKGQSVEVLSSSILKTIYPLMEDPRDKEHVTCFIYNHQEKFSIYNFESGEDYGNIQLSVDTFDDMVCFKKILDSLKKPHWEYPFEEFVIKLEEY